MWRDCSGVRDPTERLDLRDSPLLRGGSIRLASRGRWISSVLSEEDYRVAAPETWIVTLHGEPWGDRFCLSKSPRVSLRRTILSQALEGIYFVSHYRGRISKIGFLVRWGKWQAKRERERGPWKKGEAVNVNLFWKVSRGARATEVQDANLQLSLPPSPSAGPLPLPTDSTTANSSHEGRRPRPCRLQSPRGMKGPRQTAVAPPLRSTEHLLCLLPSWHGFEILLLPNYIHKLSNYFFMKLLELILSVIPKKQRHLSKVQMQRYSIKHFAVGQTGNNLNISWEGNG